MWSDVVIGSGHKGNTAVAVRNVSNRWLSESGTAFWISSCSLGLRV